MTNTYQDAAAFRQAIEARLKSRHAATGADLQWLRRQVAFDRLLARLFTPDRPLWILKSGYAMELRLADRARTTQDIDLMTRDEVAAELFQSGETGYAEVFDQLQQAAALDLGDYFVYQIAKSRKLDNVTTGGVRHTVICKIAGREFVQFRLDIGFGGPVIGNLQQHDGPDLLEFAGLQPARVTVLPVEQQIAEKLHAYTYPWGERTNTRVKDLVDLVLLFETQPIDRDDLQAAIAATFEYRVILIQCLRNCPHRRTRGTMSSRHWLRRSGCR